ncbi:MAG: pilus assembly protein PilP [Bdellovibrionales bacterium]|nr:pilus assembly protein PilP [Bdellovibrionales bacterium]
MAQRRRKRGSKLPVITVLLALVAGGVYGYMRLGTEKLTERSAITKAVEEVKANRTLTSEEEQLLRIQLALVDYVAKNQGPPESLFELVPVYFDVVPNNPKTKEPFFYKKEGRRFVLRPTEEVVTAEMVGEDGEMVVVEDPIIKDEDFVNPNEMTLDLATYDSTGKRDPFTPFDFSGASSARSHLTPLEQYSLEQLRLTAVLESVGGALTAIVEDSSGKGYTVRIGTRIGLDNGVVVSVEKDKLSILETKVDITGKETQSVRELKLIGRAEAPSSRGNTRGNRRQRNNRR